MSNSEFILNDFISLKKKKEKRITMQICILHLLMLLFKTCTSITSTLFHNNNILMKIEMLINA